MIVTRCYLQVFGIDFMQLLMISYPWSTWKQKIRPLTIIPVEVLSNDDLNLGSVQGIVSK